MVSNNCCVPGCTKSAASKFGVPQYMMSVWENIIGCPLNRNSRVCANHFKPSDITLTWEFGNGSSQISICLRKPQLKSGVIPINNKCDKVNDISQANETMTMLNEHNYFKVNLNDEFEPPLAKQACIEVVIHDNTLINDESSISIPMNWFCDVTTKNGSVVEKTNFTLSLFQAYNNRIVEKRLVMLKVKTSFASQFIEFNGHWRHANCLNIIEDDKSNLSDCQSNLVNEILIRYSDNWILLCLILQIKSPSGYRFLRNQNILPLPCVKTVRKYLLAINKECGFDLNFFKLLKKKNIKYISQQPYFKLFRIGRFWGRTSNRDTEKADHGLVFIWSSLADNFTQPIAVFAFKGPVKGMDLTKLVVKAMLLEDAGAQVLGLTTNGASTNRSMWNNLGISGKIGNTNNSFCNPFDETRKFFVFSDAPHLMKTIRNRLYEKKSLKFDPSKPLVKWEHFSEVYRLDENKLGKVCPKITRNHIYLTSLSKMKVKFATQVNLTYNLLFSSSMAVGMQFYRNRNEKISYILKKQNNLPYSWESKVIDGFISSNEFLTQQTADGLRVTIKSSIKLLKYLLDNCNFSFVLTAKINQDKLERFFDIIRQVSGPNDHPSTPTFLQLYRMLTVSSLIKPPKSGNCTIDEDFISNESLREEKIKNMKSKLDLIIEDKNWNCEDIFLEHDYTKC
ncbi:hypothetical protein QTP88_005006 [Uroleucon formosanum]